MLCPSVRVLLAAGCCMLHAPQSCDVAICAPAAVHEYGIWQHVRPPWGQTRAPPQGVHVRPFVDAGLVSVVYEGRAEGFSRAGAVQPFVVVHAVHILLVCCLFPQRSLLSYSRRT